MSSWYDWAQRYAPELRLAETSKRELADYVALRVAALVNGGEVVIADDTHSFEVRGRDASREAYALASKVAGKLDRFGLPEHVTWTTPNVVRVKRYRAGRSHKGTPEEVFTAVCVVLDVEDHARIILYATEDKLEPGRRAAR
jgi:hypothetical protein